MDDDEVSQPPVVLEPAVQCLVDASAHPPHLDEIGPDDGRLALEDAQGRAPDDPRIDAEFLVAPVGPSGLVGFWIYRPAGTEEPLPAVLYVHGGKWMLGGANTHARLLHDLTLLTGAALVVPEYTRTPEARYPVAVEEIYALLGWVAGHAGTLGLDATRLAVAGDCAGATMAAAITLLTKRRSGPRLRAQLLYYPLLDPRCDSLSQELFGDGYLLTRAALRRYWQEYCDDPRQLEEPTAAPARAGRTELAGLPPALVVVGEADVVRDEGETYAANLRQAGVAAFAVRYQGTVHDFVSLTALRRSPVSRAAVRQGAEFLRERLQQ